MSASSSNVQGAGYVPFVSAVAEISGELGAIAVKLMPQNIEKYEEEKDGHFTLTMSKVTQGTLKHPNVIANNTTITVQKVVKGHIDKAAKTITFDKKNITASETVCGFKVFNASLYSLQAGSENTVTAKVGKYVQDINVPEILEVGSKISVQYKA